MRITPEKIAEIQDWAKAQNKICLIKTYRDFTKKDLTACRDAIDECWKNAGREINPTTLRNFADSVAKLIISVADNHFDFDAKYNPEEQRIMDGIKHCFENWKVLGYKNVTDACADCLKRFNQE